MISNKKITQHNFKQYLRYYINHSRLNQVEEQVFPTIILLTNKFKLNKEKLAKSEARSPSLNTFQLDVKKPTLNENEFTAESTERLKYNNIK